MKKNSKIYIAGHNGMVGSALHRNLIKNGFTNIIFKSSKELNLINQQEVYDFFNLHKPEYVIVAAAKVGGILANNTYRAEFLYNNLMIQNNIIHAAHSFNVKKLLFLGSSCIYPKMCSQPIKEEYLLTDTLENTNEPYAIAKIAGIKMCESYYRQYNCNFISAMPTNLYGINDNFDLKTSHVLPALIRKVHEAKVNKKKQITIWGTGKPLREFLFVDDLAEACLHIIHNLDAKKMYDEMNISHLNVGYGSDISILDLTKMVVEVVGFSGQINNDLTKPDGTPKKLMDSSRLKKLGWKPKHTLHEGIEKTYQWYLKNFK